MNNKWNELQQILAEQNFLTPGKNPVVEELRQRRLTMVQGAEVLRQYFYLVSNITQFLILAMVRIPVPKVKQELRRNLGEELGSRTRGKTHQEILERYLLQELGVTARALW